MKLDNAVIRRAWLSLVDGALYVFVGPFSVLYIIPCFLRSLWGAPAVPGFGQRWLQISGLSVMALGGAVALCCALSMLLAGRGTPFVASPPQKLMTHGIFGYVRNPMMWALLFVLLGEALNFGSYLLLVWLVAWGRIGHLVVVMYEEPQLESRFGEQYREYCSRVPRWFPRHAR